MENMKYSYSEKVKNYILLKLQNDEEFDSRAKFMYRNEVERAFEMLETKNSLRDIALQSLGNSFSVSDFYSVDDSFVVFKAEKNGKCTYHTIDIKKEKVLSWAYELRSTQVLFTLGYQSNENNAPFFANYARKMLIQD